MSKLFRSEVQKEKQAQWLGVVRLSQPMSHGLVAAVGLAVATIIGTFATLGSYTRKATVPGLLQPVGGALRLTSQSNGLIADINVAEGDAVKAGQVLFVLSGERISAQGDTQALIARELKRRAEITVQDAVRSKLRAEERIRGLNDRVRAIDNEIASFRHDTELFAARERIARDAVNRYEKLASTGFVSSAQTDAQREALLALQAQQQALKRSRAELARERSNLLAQVEEVRMQQQSEASELSRSSALLAQETSEHEARSRLAVTAPADGTITGLSIQPGQPVDAGTLLATFLPHGIDGKPQPLQAQFFATTRQAGFVEKGQTVRIRYAAYPYQKFGMGEGEVTEISQSPYAVQELPAHMAASLTQLAKTGDPVYRVTVKISEQTIKAYGNSHALRPGMIAEADIVQDTRKLWEWALEPVFSVSGKLVASSKSSLETGTSSSVN